MQIDRRMVVTVLITAVILGPFAHRSPATGQPPTPEVRGTGPAIEGQAQRHVDDDTPKKSYSGLPKPSAPIRVPWPEVR